MTRLVLTRRPGAALCIGDEICVRVLSISGANVRISIEAPANVSVDREEIRERKLAGRHEIEWSGLLAADVKE